MRTSNQLRGVIPARTRWLLCLLAAITGVLATTTGFGIGASVQASANPATTNSAVDTTAATTTDTKSYSGGRLMAADPSGGYWTVNPVGAITPYGGAPSFGSPSLSAIHLNQPIVGMAATTDGGGYWLVASDGGIFTFGDAKFSGSTGAIHLNQPIVGMAATTDGGGYWLVASDGGIFTFGDAKFSGSLAGTGKPVIGIMISPPTQGYTLVELDGTAVVPTLTPVAAGLAPTTPTAGGVHAIPTAPSSLGAPTKLVLDDEFTGGSLNKTVWSPLWFGDGAYQQGTIMREANVSVGANGLELTLASNSTGAIVSSNPADKQPGHAGFQIAPTAGAPVYVEYTATLPASGGQIANWPALWLTGQNWPMDGEIDVMEGFGTSQYHVHYGPSPSDASGPGGIGGTTAGTHTFGVLWTTTGVTFVYDGSVVGSESVSMTSPMFLVMENSLPMSRGGAPLLVPSTVTVRDVRVWQ
jgi:hypothetical protein